MKKHPRILLAIIILLTVAAVIIDLPKFPISIDTPTLPVINKQIHVHKTYPGLTINFTSNGAPVQKTFEFKRGLDLEGGTSITLRADMKNIPEAQRADALEGAKTVLERRVNLYGVSEPVIQTIKTNGDYRITVELPGVDIAQTRQLIGTTAQLSFWEQGASGSAEASPSALPLGIPQVLGNNAVKTNLTGKDLQNATTVFDQNTGVPQVQLTFTSEGAKKFADITSRNVNKVVAIVLDNVVVEAPRVNQAILTGNAVITGSFTTDQAKALSIELQAGALPVSLTPLESRSIGATLGQGALEKSLFAGILGFAIVVIFMVLLYGRLGVLASIALILYTLFVLALFKGIPITLTLAGIAGFILSIGMAVDANILIFERMKEEFRLGKSQSTAVELGFSRAWPSIRDSNASTLITSSILYIFGTGIVRGFAVTLAIGVIVSMFSAIVVTRTLIRVFYKH